MKNLFALNQAEWKHKLLVSYIKSPNHPTKLRLAKWLQNFLGLKNILFVTDSGIKMLLYSEDYVQYQILYNGMYEEKTVQLIKSLLKEGDCFVDIGSHVGLYSLEGSRIVGSSGKIFAFEPNPKTFNRLLLNIQLNNTKNIYPMLMAVSNKNGVVTMDLPPGGNWGITRSSHLGSDNCFITLSVRLDTLFISDLKINKIDVIKMDVEGLELSVLEGLMESNIIFPRNIIFEYIPNSFSHAYDAAMYLINKGYDLYDVLGNPYDINTKETLIDLNLWAKKENE